MNHTVFIFLCLGIFLQHMVSIQVPPVLLQIAEFPSYFICLNIQSHLIVCIYIYIHILVCPVDTGCFTNLETL